MKYDYIKFFESKLKELSRENFILDVGGGSPFQKKMAKYRNLFVGKRYETLDVSPEYKPTILGDIHNLPLADNSVDAILCNSVLEHVQGPEKAVNEMWRVLKENGKILVFTHFIYPYHAREGIYGDFFRFSEESLRHLFRSFSKIETKKEGGYFRAMMFFLPFQARLRPIWEPVAYFLDKLFKTEKRTTTAGYYLYAEK